MSQSFSRIDFISDHVCSFSVYLMTTYHKDKLQDNYINIPASCLGSPAFKPRPAQRLWL